MIPAGKFKYLISIQSPSTSRDAMGGVVETWITKYANVPAFVEDFSGREKFHVESSREVSYEQKRIEIRYLKGITKVDRIVYDTLVYDILRIEQLGFRESTRFTVQLAE